MRVALIGANGHGMTHRRHLAELAGKVDFAGMADLAPVADAPPGVPVFTDHAELLRATAPDVVIVCTPPHTHLAVTRDALRAGADVLLEKPPVLDLAEHAALAQEERATGRVVQVGFQALASPALGELRAAVRRGAFGALTGVSVVGSWQRPDAYWTRSAWSGRRMLGGRPSLDGALANPFAHAIMQALAVLDADPAQGGVEAVEVSWSRLRPIEVEETATLRVTLAGGAKALVAVTLVGEGFIDGELVVQGSGGEAVLAFRDDLLRLPGEEELRAVPGRVSLLENLIAHRASGAELFSPLARTAGFTSVIEALRQAPPPEEIDPRWYDVDGDRRTLRGVNEALLRCARGFALLNELETPWSAHSGSEAANRST